MTIELDELAGCATELRSRLRAGEEVTLLDGGQFLGTLVPRQPPASPAARNRLGFAKGSVAWIAPDFDDPLPEEFWHGGNP